MEKNKILYSRNIIEEQIQRLEEEFLKRSISLSLEDRRNIFATMMGFSNWIEFDKSLSYEENIRQFETMMNGLSNSEKNKYIEEILTKEDSLSLKKFIDYIMNNKATDSSYWQHSGHIYILDKIKDKTPQFQNSVLNATKDYFEITTVNACNFLCAVCALKVEDILLDNILKSYDFDLFSLQNGLITACENNNLDVIKYLIHNYPQIDINDVFYYQNNSVVFNPLCCAVRSDSFEAMEYLITANADIHIQNDMPLFIACTNGYIHIVHYLLACSKEKADIYAKDGRCLLLAAIKNHDDIVQFLLYDMNMQINDQLFKSIKMIEDNEISEKLIKMIEKRNLYQHLDTNLIDDVLSKKEKIKI